MPLRFRQPVRRLLLAGSANAGAPAHAGADVANLRDVSQRRLLAANRAGRRAAHRWPVVRRRALPRGRALATAQETGGGEAGGAAALYRPGCRAPHRFGVRCLRRPAQHAAQEAGHPAAVRRARDAGTALRRKPAAGDDTVGRGRQRRRLGRSRRRPRGPAGQPGDRAVRADDAGGRRRPRPRFRTGALLAWSAVGSWRRLRESAAHARCLCGEPATRVRGRGG